MDTPIPDPHLTKRLAELLDSREEILEAYLFGSHARGQAQPHSDVDVAVYIDHARADDTGFGYRANLTTDLMAGLGCNDVDVVVLNRAPPLLYHRVLRDGVRLLARDLRATTTREGRARVPLLRLRTAARKDGSREAFGGGPQPVRPGTRRLPGGAASPCGAARGACESAPSRRIDTRRCCARTWTFAGRSSTGSSSAPGTPSTSPPISRPQPVSTPRTTPPRSIASRQ